MISIYNLIDYWNIFFFKPEPATTIGLVRILFGIISLVDFALLCKRADWYFTSTGVYPDKIFLNSANVNRLNIFKYIPSKIYYIYIVLSIGMLAAFCLSVGFCTALSCSIVYLIKVSLCHRNIYIFNSGDSLFRILMFLMIFSRAGDAISMDCYLQNKSQLNTLGAPWCERLMMIQTCTVYAFTAWLKICSKPWVNGDASYYPINLISFKNGYVPKFLQNAPWVQIATWLTILAEEMNAFAIWITELRYISIINGIMLHTIFAYCLKLEIFSYVMMAAILLFVPPEDLSRWIEELCRIL